MSWKFRFKLSYGKQNKFNHRRNYCCAYSRLFQQQKTALVQTTAEQNSQPQIEPVQPADAQQKGQSAEDIIAHAFKNKLSNVQVEGTGQVKAVLRDDNEGSRHQKFILTLNNGQTLLVAHFTVNMNIQIRGVWSTGHITIRMDVIRMVG